MDEELKKVLAEMRQENATAHAETRQQVAETQRSVEETQRSLAETQRQVAATQRSVDEIRQENATAHAETRRHFDVSLERMGSRFDLLAKSVQILDKRLTEKATTLEEKIERTAADTQAMIKFSHADLDRRVRSLE